jgi:hypothetical protein
MAWDERLENLNPQNDLLLEEPEHVFDVKGEQADGEAV